MALNAMQQYALRRMQQGKNVFLSGDAGTGKSYVVRKFLESAREQQKKVLAVAPTGIAALNIDGATVHRAFKAPTGILHTKPSPSQVPDPVKQCDVLLVDEVSMLRIDLYEYMINSLLTRKGKKLPQLVFVGDFCQLPPVLVPSEKEIFGHFFGDRLYLFESDFWKTTDMETILLTKTMRQKNQTYTKNLNLIRRGDPSGIEYFNKNFYVGEGNDNLDQDAITLCATNRKVKEINTESLEKLQGKLWTYTARETGNVKESDRVAEKTLALKKDALVMFLKNDPDGRFQNGSLGKVTYLSENEITVKVDGYRMPIVRYRWEITEPEYNENTGKIDYKVVASTEQFPLKLAYASTIHKSQGKTIPKINLYSAAFAHGQLYVALSRVASPDGLRLITKIKPEYLITDTVVLDFYGYNKRNNESLEYTRNTRTRKKEENPPDHQAATAETAEIVDVEEEADVDVQLPALAPDPAEEVHTPFPVPDPHPSETSRLDEIVKRKKEIEAKLQKLKKKNYI